VDPSNPLTLKGFAEKTIKINKNGVIFYYNEDEDPPKIDKAISLVD